MKTSIHTNMVEVGHCTHFFHRILSEKNKGHMLLVKTYRTGYFRMKWDFRSTASDKSLRKIQPFASTGGWVAMHLTRYGVLFPQPPSLLRPELRKMGNSPKIGYFDSNGELSRSSIVPPERLDWDFGKDTFSNKVPSAVHFCHVALIVPGVRGKFPTHCCFLGEVAQELGGCLALQATFSVPELLFFLQWPKIEFLKLNSCQCDPKIFEYY